MKLPSSPAPIILSTAVSSIFAPEPMRIDAHQHFWNYDSQRDTWITEELSILRRDFSPEELLPELVANDMDASLAVQAAQSEEETNFLLRLAEESSCIAGVIGWVDLRDAGVEERLEWFRKFPKLCGFRHIVQSEPDDRFLLQPEFVRGIRLLHRFRFTYDVLIYPRQLPAAVEFANILPEQRFVLDHIAKPDIKLQRKDNWEHYIRSLAQNQNVFCKLSGMVTEADWKLWRPADFQYYLDVVFDVFGPARLMFGSDWPVCLLAASYGQVVQLVSDYVLANCPAQLENIFGANAARFYNLKFTPDELSV
jgi:L-fucono-1,5-lactonase